MDPLALAIIAGLTLATILGGVVAIRLVPVVLGAALGLTCLVVDLVLALIVPSLWLAGIAAVALAVVAMVNQ